MKTKIINCWKPDNLLLPLDDEYCRLQRKRDKIFFKYLVIGMIAMIAAVLLARACELRLNEPEIGKIIEPIEKYQVIEMIDLTDFSVEKKIEYFAKKYNGNPKQIIALAKCESSLNPVAIGDNGWSYGLFQIHQYYHPNTQEIALDIEQSVKWVIEKAKKDNGFSAWSCNRKISQTF